MFAQPMSKPRLKSIIFYQNSPKIKSFLQKNAKFSSAGGSAPQTTKTAPLLRISGYAPVQIYSNNSTLLVDVLMLIFYRAYTK